jgi:HK97 family phage prohead protease
MKKFTKLFNTRPSSINDTDKSVTFTISDNQPDRMGEVVEQTSWDFKNYLNNPIILWGHDPEAAENVLGTASTINVSPDGSHTEATLSFATEINPKAKMVFDMIKAGILRTVSVGFVNHTYDTQDDTPVLKDNELLEISVVPIPANPRAIALSYREGSIARKDASWLLSSMKKEAEYLEEQLSKTVDPGVVKEKQVEELTQQVTNLTNLVAKLAESQVSLTDTVSKLAEAPAETDEQKTAREAQEAADKAAADAQTEKDRLEAEAAKGGDIDQSGAGEVEFDPDAELTDEQVVEVEAALAELEPVAA